jgi:glycosyltransferase involved in cell wall biosynthesis
MTRRLYFVINQDPMDGSAHALYSMRHLGSLSERLPADWALTLVCPSASAAGEILAGHHIAQSANVDVRVLPSLRRGSSAFGLHMNAVFHWAAWAFLSSKAGSDDVVATASFPRLFEFLASRFRKKPSRPRLIYEVHQLECLSRPPDHPKCVAEFQALSLADRLLATTGPLEEILRKKLPAIPCFRTGLAVSYRPVPRRKRNEGTAFKTGYFGSVSPEQGIPWLIENWPRLGLACELHIFGRLRRGETLNLPPDTKTVFLHPTVPPDEVPNKCRDLDALIIPALDQGHRSAIAFTKAYDFLGLALPIVASDLPTIREVLRNDVQALLFPPGDFDAMKACLARLSADDALCNSLHEACVAAAPECSWSSRAGQWWRAATE